MKLIGLMPCHNEGWILGLSARVALEWVDALVIFNHASTDNTSDIINELVKDYGNRIIPMYESDANWHEMSHRQNMLLTARAEGATHIAIIDADELLSANLLTVIRHKVSANPQGCIVRAPIYNMRGTIDQYHSNGIWSEQTTALAFQNEASASWLGDQFHHREPFGIQCSPNYICNRGEGGVMHLWGVTERRLIARHALYKITERLRWPQKSIVEIDSYYNMAIYPPGVSYVELLSPYTSAKERIEHRGEPAQFAIQSNAWAFATTPLDWIVHYGQFMKYLNMTQIPWQEEECKRLVSHYGTQPFDGLNLFGVV